MSACVIADCVAYCCQLQEKGYSKRRLQPLPVQTKEWLERAPGRSGAAICKAQERCGRSGKKETPRHAAPDRAGARPSYDEFLLEGLFRARLFRRSPIRLDRRLHERSGALPFRRSGVGCSLRRFGIDHAKRLGGCSICCVDKRAQ